MPVHGSGQVVWPTQSIQWVRLSPPLDPDYFPCVQNVKKIRVEPLLPLSCFFQYDGTVMCGSCPTYSTWDSQDTNAYASRPLPRLDRMQFTDQIDSWMKSDSAFACLCRSVLRSRFGRTNLKNHPPLGTLSHIICAFFGPSKPSHITVECSSARQCVRNVVRGSSGSLTSSGSEISCPYTDLGVQSRTASMPKFTSIIRLISDCCERRAKQILLGEHAKS